MAISVNGLPFGRWLPSHTIPRLDLWPFVGIHKSLTRSAGIRITRMPCANAPPSFHSYQMSSSSAVAASPSQPNNSRSPAGAPEKFVRVEAAQLTTVQCTHCSHSNFVTADADAKFCNKCGNALWVPAASAGVRIEDALRASLQEFLKIHGVKDESSDSDGEMPYDANDSIHVIENVGERICC